MSELPKRISQHCKESPAFRAALIAVLRDEEPVFAVGYVAQALSSGEKTMSELREAIPEYSLSAIRAAVYELLSQRKVKQTGRSSITGRMCYALRSTTGGKTNEPIHSTPAG